MSVKSAEANPIDVHVGKRLRLRRSILSISQEKLAELLGITFQQVQKYEKGINRIGSSRLFDISKHLNVPVGFFFEEYNEGRITDYSFAEDKPGFEHEEGPTSKETAALIKAYSQIVDPKIRKKALELIKSLAETN